MLLQKITARNVYKLLRFFSILPYKFRKHYLYPLLNIRQKVPYDARSFFDTYYKNTIPREFSDRITINSECDIFLSRYHYNAVENSIIEYFATKEIPQNAALLDIGSGAGHWIDFYLNVFGINSAVGIDISNTCVSSLRKKYSTFNNIQIIEGDIGTGLDLKNSFDIINAIGIMFHIVDDGHWKAALKNIARHLKSRGVCVISGQFGLITQNVQYEVYDDPDTAFVNKRIRSLRLWKKCAEEAGLSVASFTRTRQDSDLHTPENNILILMHHK